MENRIATEHNPTIRVAEIKTVQEGFSPQSRAKDLSQAEQTVRKQLSTQHPLAEFNLRPDQSRVLPRNVEQLPFHVEPKKGLTEESHKPGTLRLPSFAIDTESLKRSETMIDPQTGQTLDVIRLNWEGKGYPVMYVPEYGGAAKRFGPMHIRMEEIARQTGRPVFEIDYPGMAQRNLTREQKRAMKAGDFGPIAQAQLRIMKEMGITDVDLVGFSMGGWASSFLAKEAEGLGISVHTAMVLDAPGVQERSGLNLMKADMADGAKMPLYQSTPYDIRMRKAAGTFGSLIEQLEPLVWWLPNTLRRGGMKYTRAMGRSTVAKNMHEALDKNADLSVQFIHASASMVSPTKANHEVVASLQGRFPSRVTETIFAGDTHTFVEDPNRFGTIVRLGLIPPKK